MRQLDARDVPAAARLLDETLAATPYVERAREILHAAMTTDAEWQLAVAVETPFASGALAALAAFGPVHGAQAVWRLGYLVFAGSAAGHDVARQIITHVVQTTLQAGARMLVAEWPADEAIGFALSSLRANGFRQDARIPDFYRDGVAQLFLRRDLNSDPVHRE